MKVSAVIPMYNAKDTIVATLDSIRLQTEKDIEVIVVNDGSTDGSPEVVTEYADCHPEVSIRLINQPNSGVSAARNKGMRNTQGEFIALIDSDDVWLPNKIERQLNLIEQNPGIDFLATNRNGEIFSRFLHIRLGYLTRISAKALLYKMFFITPTVIFKREVLDEVGFFDEAQKYGEDGQFFIRMAFCRRCFLLNESLVITGGGKAHFGEKGLSSNLKAMQNGELRNLQFARRQGIVNGLEYPLVVMFSWLKYVRRRLVVVFKRKI